MLMEFDMTHKRTVHKCSICGRHCVGKVCRSCYLGKPISRLEVLTMTEFVEIKEQSNRWNPKKEGDKIAGYLDGREQSQKYDSTVLKITVSDKNSEFNGQQISVFCTKILEEKTKEIPIGAQIQIVFKGIPQGKRYKDWSVFIAKNDIVKEEKIG